MAIVQLHVYDVTPSDKSNPAVRWFNNIGRETGAGGIFHGGVEIYDAEWSFGYSEGSGVYSCAPKTNPMYRYRETVMLGVTSCSHHEVQQMILKLRSAWHGTTYELLTRNCLHFCDALASGLGVPAIPAYLNRMAYGAEAVTNLANSAIEQVSWLSAATHAWWTSPSSGATKQTVANNSRHAASGIKFAVPPQWQSR